MFKQHITKMFEKKKSSLHNSQLVFSIYESQFPDLLSSQSQKNFLIELLCVFNNIMYVKKRLGTLTKQWNH